MHIAETTGITLSRSLPRPRRGRRSADGFTRAACIAFGLLVCAVLTMRAAGQCRYEVQATFEAPSCFQPASVSVQAMSNAGLVVGYYSNCADPDDAFVWTPEQGFRTLARPAGHTHFRAYDVNEAGEVVGSIYFPGENNPRAMLWENGNVVDLGVLPGDNLSEAEAINNEGRIVGYSIDNVSGRYRAVTWDPGTHEIHEIPLPLNPTHSSATDIDAQGRITGWMGEVWRQDTHAFLMHESKVMDLGIIPGGATAEPAAMNERGQVVGRGRVGNLSHAFLASDSSIIDLGLIGGYERNEAYDINDLGQVVGFMSNGLPGEHKFAWVWQDGRLAKLNDLVPPELELDLNLTSAINDLGQITCSGIGPGGYLVAVLAPIADRPGDATLDCRVNMTDVLRVLAAWGQCNGCREDLDGNGSVDAMDLDAVFADWG